MGLSQTKKLTFSFSSHSIYTEYFQNAKYGFGPAVQSGDDFCEPATEAFDNGRTKRVPILVGYNSEEAIVFLGELYSFIFLGLLINYDFVSTKGRRKYY